MHTRKILALLTLAVATAACSDSIPTQATGEIAVAPEAALTARTPKANSGLLTNIPVTETLADGSTLEGLLSITSLAIKDGQLVGSGTLTGTVTDALGTVTQFTQSFTDTALGLTGGGGGSCAILNLDLGPLNLDLLGLVVDLSAISLDVTAERGPGKLLGNLLCAVAGLLDGGGALSAIGNLLNQINQILG